MPSKHDRIIKRLKQQLRSKYTHADIYTQHEYPGGEADLILINNGNAQAYEIKSNDGHKGKALKQLYKDSGFIRKEWGIKNAELYYVYGYKNKDKFEIEKIR